MVQFKLVFVMRILFLSVLAIVFQQSVFSQDLLADKELTPDDELIRGKLMSTYREFFKWKDYDLALESWWTLFNDYPDVSEKLYVDGVTMYRHFINETPEGQARNAKVDTLMLIYDQRMTYFGGEGNILGRKGSDLLRFRSDDHQQIEAAYGMLKKSLEIQEYKSRETVMLNYMAAGLLLQNASVIDRNQVMEDYFLVTGLLDQQGGSSSRTERTRATIDGMIEKENILSCEGLDLHFGPQFEQNSENPDLLKKIIHSYSFAGCEQSALYTSASEKLYELDPGSESAHQLALLFISRNDLEKASRYLQMAVLDPTLAILDETDSPAAKRNAPKSYRWPCWMISFPRKKGQNGFMNSASFAWPGGIPVMPSHLPGKHWLTGKTMPRPIWPWGMPS